MITFSVIIDRFDSDTKKPYRIKMHNDNGNDAMFSPMSKKDLVDLSKSIIDMLAKTD